MWQLSAVTQQYENVVHISYFHNEMHLFGVLPLSLHIGFVESAMNKESDGVDRFTHQGDLITHI